jgi:ferredoxin
MTVGLRVNYIACDGRGICADLLPEIISLDPWGYPIVAKGPVPARLVADAEIAVGACPLLALHLQRRPEAGDPAPGDGQAGNLVT